MQVFFYYKSNMANFLFSQSTEAFVENNNDQTQLYKWLKTNYYLYFLSGTKNVLSNTKFFTVFVHFLDIMRTDGCLQWDIPDNSNDYNYGKITYINPAFTQQSTAFIFEIQKLLQQEINTYRQEETFRHMRFLLEAIINILYYFMPDEQKEQLQLPASMVYSNTLTAILHTYISYINDYICPLLGNSEQKFQFRHILHDANAMRVIKEVAEYLQYKTDDIYILSPTKAKQQAPIPNNNAALLSENKQLKQKLAELQEQNQQLHQNLLSYAHSVRIANGMKSKAATIFSAMFYANYFECDNNLNKNECVAAILQRIFNDSSNSIPQLVSSYLEKGTLDQLKQELIDTLSDLQHVKNTDRTLR